MESKHKLDTTDELQVFSKQTFFDETSLYWKQLKTTSPFHTLVDQIGSELELRIGQIYSPCDTADEDDEDDKENKENHVYRVALKFKDILLLYDGPFLQNLLDRSSEVMCQRIFTTYPDLKIKIPPQITPYEHILILQLASKLQSIDESLFHKVGVIKLNNQKTIFQWTLKFRDEIIIAKHVWRFHGLLLGLGIIWQKITGVLPSPVDFLAVDGKRSTLPIIWDE